MKVVNPGRRGRPGTASEQERLSASVGLQSVWQPLRCCFDPVIVTVPLTQDL